MRSFACSMSPSSSSPSGLPRRSRGERDAAAADAPVHGVGARLEEVIEHRADVAGEVVRGERRLAERQAGRKGLRRTAFLLAVSGVSLYLVAPSVIDTLGSWRQLERVSPGWLAVMALLQLAALGCLWVLQWLALPGAHWRAVIASQLAGNALAKIAPGGGAMGGALQYRMLVSVGLPGPRVLAGLTAANLLVLAAVLSRCPCSPCRPSCAAASSATCSPPRSSASPCSSCCSPPAS